ncbi:MAG: glycosyltransferase family 4 protein, partial [Planctomycetaceae bacterium]|nr:glycosyltransferase family 4 protein [Planctomycetaceae bacterium]
MEASSIHQRLLLLSEIFPPHTGGSGRWFHEIYSRLPKEAVQIVAGEHSRQTGFDSTTPLEIERLPLRLGDWGTVRPASMRNYWHLAQKIRRVAIRADATEIHAGRCLPEGWLAWLVRWRTGIGYRLYIHGEDVETAATSREHSWMVRRVLNTAEMLIANSHNTAALLRDRWSVPDDRIVVLHPGVDTRRFCPAPRDAELRNQLEWDERTVILTVGRLQQRKGQDQMIRALKQIRRSVPDVLYAVVGSGEDGERLRTLAEQEDVREHVRFHGEIADEQLIGCYQQCDLFALPNRRVGHDIEGFGMVLLEAQACGRPVLAGRSGGTAETMRIPETGVTVNCEGPDELAAAVQELLGDSDLLNRMGEAGRRWVV